MQNFQTCVFHLSVSPELLPLVGIPLLVPMGRARGWHSGELTSPKPSWNGFSIGLSHLTHVGFSFTTSAPKMTSCSFHLSSLLVNTIVILSVGLYNSPYKGFFLPRLETSSPLKFSFSFILPRPVPLFIVLSCSLLSLWALAAFHIRGIIIIAPDWRHFMQSLPSQLTCYMDTT